jgi:hypothetical protein
MTDTLTVRPDPDNPAATVVESNGNPIVYVYPTAWDDKWAWVAGRRGSGLLDTEAEAWQQIRESPDLFTDDHVMARQLVAICEAKETPND